MGVVKDAFDSTYRDYVIAGLPSSGAHEPIKSQIRGIGVIIEQFIGSAGVADAIYETTAAGIAATTNSELFLVKGDGVNSFADLYKNVGGVAVYQGISIPSVESIDEKLKSRARTVQTIAERDAIPVDEKVDGLWVYVTDDEHWFIWDGAAWVGQASAAEIIQRLDDAIAQVDVTDIIPIVAQTSTGKVPLWLEQGNLDFRGLTQGARDKATADVVTRTEITSAMRPLWHSFGRVFMWLDDDGDFDAKGVSESFQVKATEIVTRKVGNVTRYRPLAEVGGQVPIWIDGNGLFGAKGLSASLVSSIQVSLATIFAPQVSNRPVPLATDGATLGHFNALIGILRAGGAVQVPLGINGDSWSEQFAISQGIQAVLAEEFTVLQAPGFMSIREGGVINGVVRTASAGWNQVDGSATTVFTYGAGPDGKAIWTNAADQTLSYTNVVAKTLEIYYRNHGGTFEYRYDGGAWTQVVCTNDGSFGFVSITGLAEVPHTLEIRTTGNTGIVSLVGAAGLTDSPGIILHRWGNGGTTGYMVNQYVPAYAAPILARLGIVLNFTILGTNDYRGSASPPSETTLALSNVMTAVRSAVPDAAIVACIPCRSGGVTVTPLSAYRDAMFAWAVTNGGEALNLYDQLPDYPVSVGYGIWADALHLNDNGGRWVADCIKRAFMGEGR